MKNLFYSGLLLTATLMAACSSEDNTGTESQKGMTLYATVSDTRATMTDDNGNWKFAFAANDVVKVGNDKVSDYYTFTNNGTNFTSSDAKTTNEAASWYAYFPSNEVSLAGQSGDFSGVANYYALSGSTTPQLPVPRDLASTLNHRWLYCVSSRLTIATSATSTSRLATTGCQVLRLRPTRLASA